MRYFAVAMAFLLMSSVTSYGADKPRQLTGEITALDVKTGILSLKGKRGELTCNTTAETKFKDGKKIVTLGDLKAGKTVMAKYVEDGGKMRCVSVTIESDEKVAAK